MIALSFTIGFLYVVTGFVGYRIGYSNGYRAGYFAPWWGRKHEAGACDPRVQYPPGGSW